MNSADQVGLLTSVAPRRRRRVLVRMTDVNAPGFGSACEVEDTVNAILDPSQLDLIGLHCEIGSQERDFISYPAAIGQMIAEMAQLRQDSWHRAHAPGPWRRPRRPLGRLGRPVTGTRETKSISHSTMPAQLCTSPVRSSLSQRDSRSSVSRPHDRHHQWSAWPLVAASGSRSRVERGRACGAAAGSAHGHHRDAAPVRDVSQGHSGRRNQLSGRRPVDGPGGELGEAARRVCRRLVRRRDESCRREGDFTASDWSCTAPMRARARFASQSTPGPVASSWTRLQQVAVLSRSAARTQRLLVDVTVQSADVLAAEIMARPRLDLIGLHCRVGDRDREPTGEIVREMIAQMSWIRHRHAVVLTRISLAGAAELCCDRRYLRDVSEELDEALDDACARFRYPRPALVVPISPSALNPTQVTTAVAKTRR